MGNRQEAAERLRQTREAKGISLEDAQNKTKIHIGMLRALERGETPRNVNPIYLKGFLKIYAGFLGLDPKLIIDGFNLNLPVEDRQIKVKEEPRKKELNFSLQQPRFRAVARFIIPLVGLLVVIFLVSFLFHKRPKSVMVKSSLAASSSKTENISLEKSSGIKLGIHAKESVYIHIKSDGKTVFKGILRRGLSDTWKAKEKMEVSLGDAAAAELEVNGKRLPPFGRRGETIKNIRISQDSISVGEPR